MRTAEQEMTWNQCVLISTKMEKCNNSCKALYASGWPDKVKEVADLVRGCMMLHQINLLEAIIKVAQVADHDQSYVVLVLGAGFELLSKKDL